MPGPFPRRPPVEDELGVLELVAAAEEVLRDRVPEATARPPRDDLVMLRFMT